MTDQEVLQAMYACTGNERKSQVRWLKQLAEVERKRLFALAGYPSLWAFVHRGLNYSEGSVGKRIQVMRLAEKFPLAYELLEKSEVSMGVLSRLSPHVNEKNHQALLHQVKGKSVAEAEILVASLNPKPEVRDSLRKSPAAKEQAEMEVTPSPRSIPKPKVAPLTPEYFHVNFTISRELAQKHKRLKELTRHLPKPPSMEAIFQAGLEQYLKKYDLQEKLAPKAESSKKPLPRKHTRYIPREIKRTVFQRDKGQCTYVSPDGKRCGATTQLHFDHRIPFGLGGSSHDSKNIRLLCQAHNLWQAVQWYGPNKIDRHLRRPWSPSGS